MRVEEKFLLGFIQELVITPRGKVDDLSVGQQIGPFGVAVSVKIISEIEVGCDGSPHIPLIGE